MQAATPILWVSHQSEKQSPTTSVEKTTYLLPALITFSWLKVLPKVSTSSLKHWSHPRTTQSWSPSLNILFTQLQSASTVVICAHTTSTKKKVGNWTLNNSKGQSRPPVNKARPPKPWSSSTLVTPQVLSSTAKLSRKSSSSQSRTNLYSSLTK